MKIVHVIASLADQSAGPSYSVSRLRDSLENLGAMVWLHSVDGWRSASGCREGRSDAVHRQDFAAVPVLGRLCLSRDLRCSLSGFASRLDVLHTHGLWLMPNVYPAWVARRAGRPLVISPRGMLGQEALAFSPLKKVGFWYLLQKRAVEAALCIHATCEQEYREIRAFGLANPVAIIPNGIDLPEVSESPSRMPGERVVLFLGRIHPKKGLDRLLRAWAQVEEVEPEWRLRIVGPGENGYETDLRRLAAELGLARVSFDGPVFGNAKLDAYRSADLFVLPSLNENFAMTVAEALAAGVPVISTKGAPWSGLESKKCGWWIEHGVGPLAAALQYAMAIPCEELRAMGARGRGWMARDFSWDRIGRDMLDVYQWLAGGMDPPALVRFD